MYCYATDIKIKVLKAFQQVGYKLQIKVITSGVTGLLHNYP